MSEHLDNPLPPPVTDEARRLRGELDLATKSRDAWEAEARQAKIEAAAQRDERHADWLRLGNENYHLKAQIDRLEVELERAHADLDEANAANLQRTRAAEINRDFLAKHEAEIQRLKAELSATGLAHNQACEDLGDAAAEVDRLNEQIDSERLGYKREVGRLKDELAQTQAQAARTEEDRLAAYRLLDKALAEVEGLKAELSATGLAHRQACEGWGDTAAEVDRLNDELDAARRELVKAREVAPSKAQAEVARLEGELRDATAEIKRLGERRINERATHAQAVEDLHAAIEARDREIAALKATPLKVWRRTEITPTPDIATCVRLLSLARGTEEVEAVARVVARLLGQGGET